MNLYQLYSNPTELKWYDEANEKILEVFASDDDGEFDHNKSYSYTPEQIKSIAKDLLFAYYYASEILKHRWTAAEPYIKTDPYLWPAYKRNFKIK